MKNTMTYAQALTIAIDTIEDTIVRDRLTTLRETLAKRSGSKSDESKAKANAKRKAKNAEARAIMLSEVLPIIRDVIPTTSDCAMTAKDIFGACAEALPEGFTVGKVQYILLHDIPEIQRIEAKNSPNGYYIEG